MVFLFKRTQKAVKSNKITCKIPMISTQKLGGDSPIHDFPGPFTRTLVPPKSVHRSRRQLNPRQGSIGMLNVEDDFDWKKM